MSLSDRGIQFGYGLQSTNRTTGVVASAGLRIRKEGSLPKFLAGMVPVEAPTYQGKWGDADNETMAGYRLPTFPYPGYLVPGLLKLGLDQVMTDTPDVDQHDYALLSGVNCQPGATEYLSLWRRNAIVADQDERLIGAVMKGFKLSSSFTQQRVNLDIDFLGYEFEDGQDGSGGTYTLPTESLLLHSGLTFKIDTVAKQCPELDLAVDFGVTPVLDDADKSQEDMLGKLTIEGTVKMPWANDDEQADYLGSTAAVLTFLWGVAAASGYLELTLPVKFDEPPQDKGEERIRQELPFHLSETSGQAPTISLQV